MPFANRQIEELITWLVHFVYLMTTRDLHISCFTFLTSLTGEANSAASSFPHHEKISRAMLASTETRNQIFFT